MRSRETSVPGKLNNSESDIERKFREGQVRFPAACQTCEGVWVVSKGILLSAQYA